MVKNKNDFINAKIPGRSLSDIIRCYNNYTERINIINEQLKYMVNTNDKNLSLALQLDIYKIIQNQIRDLEYAGLPLISGDVDLSELKASFIQAYPKLLEYIKLKDKLENYIIDRDKLLTSEHITFHRLERINDCPLCDQEHTFIKDGSNLTCIFCGATTKDYDLNKNEKKLLLKCAEVQRLLIPNANEKDLSFIDNLTDYYLSKNGPLYDDESYKSFSSIIRSALNEAHLYDHKTIDSIVVLSYIEKNALLKSLSKFMESIKDNDSRFKDLMMEDAITAKYEILILAGEHLLYLYKKAKEINEEVYLSKAYYNLSNIDYRKNSDYFRGNDNLRETFKCITASKEINKMVLDMKLRR